MACQSNLSTNLMPWGNDFSKLRIEHISSNIQRCHTIDGLPSLQWETEKPANYTQYAMKHL